MICTDLQNRFDAKRNDLNAEIKAIQDLIDLFEGNRQIIQNPRTAGMGIPNTLVANTTAPPVDLTSLPVCSSIEKQNSKNGVEITCFCPANFDTTSGSGNLWGTFTYTDDSDVCKAAMLEGRLTAVGGTVSFVHLPG